MVAKVLEPGKLDKHGKLPVCGFEQAKGGKLGVCGCEAVITVGRTALCKAHGEYAVAMQPGLDCQTEVGNGHYVSITREQFKQEAGLD